MISENLVQVKRCIIEAAKRAGRDPSGVRLLAVTKEQSDATVAKGIQAGMTLLGENKVQEASGKIEAFGRKNGLEWHFIGRLQKNKVKFIFDLFDLIHSVDSLALAEAIHKKAQKIGSCMPILLQVNISGEKSKLGIDPLDLPREIRKFAKLEGVKISGLMTIPPFDRNPETSRPYYARLRELRDTCSSLNIPRIYLDELSMGMSNDYEVAIEEGATLVRVGTGLFGPRPSLGKRTVG
ncbi:MAG TPA: YggS family pyridoxal phosphate-dependent enzyme [Nitrospinaceae bacterium]|nr:YggS family pyridoxal phosphate-dependent enzyme [Nitrospinaceae bacterium]HIN88753.1 YggS family pyridoxal phosphate-dependent enzyme [Nitrospinaceae bacterium]HIO24251.1 YggS family pyridoxal phosphate-dependent enzyme [Nitrospinaceae bacterium]